MTPQRRNEPFETTQATMTRRLRTSLLRKSSTRRMASKTGSNTTDTRTAAATNLPRIGLGRGNGVKKPRRDPGTTTITRRLALISPRSTIPPTRGDGSPRARGASEMIRLLKGVGREMIDVVPNASGKVGRMQPKDRSKGNGGADGSLALGNVRFGTLHLSQQLALQVVRLPAKAPRTLLYWSSSCSSSWSA